MNGLKIILMINLVFSLLSENALKAAPIYTEKDAPIKTKNNMRFIGYCKELFPDARDRQFLVLDGPDQKTAKMVHGMNVEVSNSFRFNLIG